MILLVLTLLAVVVVGGGSIWWVVGLIDALKRPDPEWARAGQSKVLFVLLMVFLGLIGTIAYWFAARPTLQRASLR